MRIVFMGTPEFSVPSLEALMRSNHTVVGVVTQPDRPKGRGHELAASPVKQLAAQHRIPILQPLKMKAAVLAVLDATNRWMGSAVTQALPAMSMTMEDRRGSGR